MCGTCMCGVLCTCMCGVCVSGVSVCVRCECVCCVRAVYVSVSVSVCVVYSTGSMQEAFTVILGECEHRDL